MSRICENLVTGLRLALAGDGDLCVYKEKQWQALGFNERFAGEFPPCTFQDAEAMRYAVDRTMKRYPYFCVELKKNDEYYLAENTRPVVISSSLHGVALNTAESNYHLISFSFSDNWIIMDIAHAITDGSGAYAVVRTFLHYYMSKKYGVELNGNGTRLCGDEICIEEYSHTDFDAVKQAFSRVASSL